MVRKSLDDILDGNDSEPEAVTTPEVAQTPEPDGPVRDESGRFAPKGVKEQAEPVEAESPSAELPQEAYAPMKGERERRQRAEKERDDLLNELKALRDTLTKQPTEPPAPAPTIWEDEQGWQQHFGGQVVSQAVQQATYQSKLYMSEMLMAQQHDDFPAIKQELVEFVGTNPAVNEQVATSQHPWLTAYQAFKNHKAMSELGATDLDSLKAKMREELLAELQGAQKPALNIPPSLSSQRSVGARTGPQWSGPTPLEELLRK